jgi:quercetin dioxygenase-like cupin family protein
MSLSAVEIVPSQDETMSTPEPGLRRQVMSYSPGMMLVRHRMQKGWVGARHSHPHEQLVYIVSGHLSFQHPGGVFDAKAGDSFLVPGNVEHQASAVEDSEVLDIFTPYREDYSTPVQGAHHARPSGSRPASIFPTIVSRWRSTMAT